MKASQIEQFKDGIIKNLRLDFFEDEEIDAILHEINSFDHKIRRKIFSLCLNLSSASSSLVQNSLRKIKAASRLLSLNELESWLGRAFELLDSQGIDPFMSFISTTDEDALNKFMKKEGVFLKDIMAILETYVRGISGKDIKIAPNHEPFTDTSTIFLPHVISRFKEPEENFLLYKIIAAHQWMQISSDTLTPDRDIITLYVKHQKIRHPDISHLFGLFKNKALALDIYNIIEASRHCVFLSKELPGLARDVEKIKKPLFEERPELSSLSEKTAFVEGLYQYFLNGKTKGKMPFSEDYIETPTPDTITKAVDRLFYLYKKAENLKGDYTPGKFFFGNIIPEKVSHRLKTQRLARRKRIEDIITKLINMPDLEPKKKPSAKGLKCDAPDPEKDYLLIKGKIVELDEEARDIIQHKEILGGILVKGSELGGCAVTLADFYEEEEKVEPKGGGIKYDEWDYRRGDYKKNWCSLYELDIHPVHEPFVESTLRRYSGYVNILRKKFELLRREPKILRRQKEGDDIDIDAAVEAFSDISAGIYPSGNLFIRLDRQERNIAALFLIDMSGSTKGWVNDAEKESLVLMCEAMESLGDRYAIYGFSGMTRTRCDFYKIKTFHETYSEMIKNRIAGIIPKDYTRMGPAIRHSSNILKSIEARTKLLITISDGKPEDWDAYKGEYSIEDTRKALVEAKELGIHPFCVTIDREAQSYLPHMFGEVNYIFIDDVKKLPNKITEIYRRLTS